MKARYMDLDAINTKYLIENSLDKHAVVKYINFEKCMGISGSTLDCYMGNYQQFPRFINIYNPETLRREQRWLKADLQQWTPPKVKRQHLKIRMMEQRLSEMQSNLPRAY